MTNAAAQLESQPETVAATEALSEPLALRQQVAERLAAHRARRGYSAPTSESGAASRTARTHPRGRHAALAGVIQERYAQSQSYRSFLAAEAERSVRQAEAIAEVATINARAISNAQQQILADLEHWDLPTEPASELPASLQAATTPSLPEAVPQAYTVRLAESLRSSATPSPARREVPDEIDVEECSALDDEILFRQDPSFETGTITPLPLSANLIEFPRQLIAARKARPRLAEGPLRDSASSDPSQLRIFEVDPASYTTAPAPIADDAAPEWSSILLPPQPATEYSASSHLVDHLAGQPVFSPTLVPQVAPIHRRLIAAMVDGMLVVTTGTAAGAVFIETIARLTHTPRALHTTPPIAALIAAGALVLLGLTYLILFFTYAESTPGMRYARIALCTFSDENPSRKAMRRRILHLALAALPCGIGLLWAFVDEDFLSWHDRLSRMYQRSY